MSAAADWRSLPLAGNGRSLVEASAGTGKTWTIAVLYLRLLLEQGLSPRQVIVSTFTNAAAAELRERLRLRLAWAQRLAESGGPPPTDEDPPDLAWLRARWTDQPELRAVDRDRLRVAIAEFDLAPVTTLHALCARILADHPFASGSLFRGRSPVDPRHHLQPLADDLWRCVWQGDPNDGLASSGRLAGVQAKDIRKFLPALVQPDVRVPGFDEDAFRRRLDFLGDLDEWVANARQLLDTDAHFNKTCTLRNHWRAVVSAIESPSEHLLKARGHIPTLRKANGLDGVSKAGKSSPGIQSLAAQSATIADVLESLGPRDLDQLEQIRLARFLRLAQDRARAILKTRLAAANQTTFDDMVSSVLEALASPNGPRALADALHAAWPVALVDEFQDTDPIQFAILDAIYRDADGRPRGRLVMIGDPKQAIYRFRGGDIQAYERAKRDVPGSDRLALQVNHRSSPAYVAAVNAFYDRAGARLGPEGSETPIAYVPVAASQRRKDEPLTDAAGEPVARPLVIHVLGQAPDVTPRTLALRACADQITHLLATRGQSIGGRPVRPSDIAVLLPSHSSIKSLSALLKSRGVPCVSRSSDQSVFLSPVANELRLVLYAALQPQEAKGLRAALATRLWGLGLADLQGLRDDPTAWNELAGRFHQFHQLLHERGPQAVVDQLMDHSAARLLRTVEGERMLTDLRHLGELLQEAWGQAQGAQALLAWLAREVHAASEGLGQDAETAAIRLESDAGRVQLMTLHASKGLEFPVVFLPLMWAHGESRLSQVNPRLLADEPGAGRWVVLGKGAAISTVQAQELEERYRILYVALTRAEQACHVFACAPDLDLKKKDKSPLNLLASRLLPPESPEEAARLPLEWRSGWALHPDAHYEEADASTTPGAARELPPAPVGPLPMRHSFTTLSGGKRVGAGPESAAAEDEDIAQDELAALPAEDPARDPVEAASSATRTHHEALDALADVAGADFGNAVHAIFEHRIPGQGLSAQLALVADSLAAHGVRPRVGTLQELAKRLADRLQQVLDAPLDGQAGPRLADLPAADLRAELEFNYALDGVSLARLRQACAACGEPDLVPRRARTLSGLMNGKIDLVFGHGGRFHVLDYKGNNLSLGERPCLEHYGPEGIAAAMEASNYRFQALLYVVALERYLRERLGGRYDRQRHLGDCWYVFVRAVGLRLPDGRHCGVWRHRFKDELLDAVQRELASPMARETA